MLESQYDAPRRTSSVGIRALKQNASQVIARVNAGEIIEITVRGRPVARIMPLQRDHYQELVDTGTIAEATAPLDDFFNWQSTRKATLQKSGAPIKAASKLTSQQVLDEQREDRL